MHCTRILLMLFSSCALATVQLGCGSDEGGETEANPMNTSGGTGGFPYPGGNAATAGGTTAATGGGVSAGTGVVVGAGTGGVVTAGTGGVVTAGTGGVVTAGTGGGVTPPVTPPISGTDAAGAGGAGTGGTDVPVEEPQCGNGVIEPGEDCESSIPVGDTCQSLGSGSGEVTCDATCQYDVSWCVADNAALFTVDYEISSAIGTVGIVTWSITAEPVTEAFIEFGLDTNYGMTAPVDLNEPDYRTLLLGMKGSRDYHFRIVAKSGDIEYQSDDYVLTTGPVTNLAQVLEVNVDNPSARAGGFIVTSLYQMSFLGGTNGFAFIADADGDIVWWYASSLSSATRARMSYDGKRMWMATEGLDMVNGIEWVTMDGLESRSFTTPITHDITAATGDVMAYPAGGFNSCVVITEITPDGTTTPIYDTGQIWTRCHANAIRYSEAEGVYTLSDRTVGDIIVVDRATGRLVERLTDYSYNWGTDQHGHHLLSDSIVFFNNGSRVTQELSLNRATMQSTEIWRYGSSYNSEVLGDAQRLPNGNTFVTYSTAGRIHEVGPDERRVMEIRFSQSISYSLWRESLYGPPPDITL